MKYGTLNEVNVIGSYGETVCTHNTQDEAPERRRKAYGFVTWSDTAKSIIEHVEYRLTTMCTAYCRSSQYLVST